MKHIASSISTFSIVPTKTLCQQEYAHDDKEQWQLDKERRELARQLRLRVRKKLAPQERFKQYQYKALDTVLAIGHETKQQYIFLEYLFGQFARYQSGGDHKGFYKSQKVMAAESGVPLKSVSDTIQKLKKANVIKSMKRGRRTRNGRWARTTNMYVLNEYFLESNIVSFLKRLYPSIEACLQPNLSGNYKKVVYLNYIHRTTDVRELPTFNEYYRDRKKDEILSFLGQKPNNLPKLEKKKETNPLNGMEYVAFNLKRDSMFDIKERTRNFPKKQEKPKEYTPPSHIPYKPSEKRSFGPNGYVKIPLEDNPFFNAFPIPDHVRENDHC